MGSYSDPDGYQNISDASLMISGSSHNEWVHYNRATNRFSMMGVAGDCAAGQATTLSSGFLTLNCGSSSASGSGNILNVTYNLTPQPPLSGTGYNLIIAVTDQGGASSNKNTGYWIVDRRPSADNCTPMNSTTPVGVQQTFVCVYSDPDGYQNFAEADLYLSGGLVNDWLIYYAAPNLFSMLGSNDICSPGQAKTISSGRLTLNCATSTVSGSGTTLTVTLRVTPQGPASGMNYNMFSGASDQVGQAYTIFAGTWQIP